MFRQVEENPIHRLVRCNVNDENYFMEMSFIRSIQRMERLRIYRAGSDDRGMDRPEGAIGYVTIQEGNVPVFSLAKLLGRPLLKKGDKHDLSLKRIIVLGGSSDSKGEEGSVRAAVMVDWVSQVMQVREDKILALPRLLSTLGVSKFSGLVRDEEVMALLLNPPELLRNKMTGGPLEHEKQEPSVIRFPVVPASPGGSPNKKNLKKRNVKGRLLIFKTGAERDISLCLSITQVSEIMRPVEITPVPLAPDYLYGTILWRNKAVPIVDLGYLLGFKRSVGMKPEGADRRLMITRGGSSDSLLGFPVDPAIRAQALPIEYTPCERPLLLNHQLVRTIVEMNEEILVMPDISRVAC